jgi:hypothetical protein
MDSISFFVVYSENKKKHKHTAYEKRRDLLTLTIHTPAATLVPQSLTLNNTQHFFLACFVYAFCMYFRTISDYFLLQPFVHCVVQVECLNIVEVNVGFKRVKADGDFSVHNVPAQVQYGLHFQRVCI